MVPREKRGALAGLTVAFASGVMVAFSQCNSPEQLRVPGPEQARGLRAPATGSVNADSNHALTQGINFAGQATPQPNTN